MCILGKAPLLSSTEPRSQFLDEGSAWSYCLPAGGAHLPRTLMFPPVLAEQRWRPWTCPPLAMPLLPWLPVALVGTALVQHSPSSASPDSYYQKSEKKCADKFCSDSSSDCGSSSGSVRASRGSWGSWSSSSSDCDRKPAVDAQHFLLPGESSCLQPIQGPGVPCRGQSRWDGTLRLGVPHSGCRLHSLPFSSWSPRVLISISFPSLKHFKDLYICMSSYCAKIFHRTDRF